MTKFNLALRTLPPTWYYVCISLLVIALISLISLVGYINNNYLIEVPANGGSLEEGIVGSPRFVNPLLAISDADRDLSSLIYAGLLRGGPSGDLVPDLAETFTPSSDGRSYTFTLRPNLTWHDGQPLTIEDIIFTVLLVQNPVIKSPKLTQWEGVTVTKVDDRTITFSRQNPTPSFLEIFTLGIMPKHIWGAVQPEAFAFSNLNLESVGAGPYRLADIRRRAGENNVPELYRLTTFHDYARGRPKINTLYLHFYQNEAELLNAYSHGEIKQITNIDPLAAQDTAVALGSTILTAPLPRLYGLFFNQSRAEVFTNHEVRLALAEALDREAIVRQVLAGYGTAITSAIPSEFLPAPATASVDRATTSPASPAERITQARLTLNNAGWTWNEASKIWEKKTKAGTSPLRFTISTANTPELKKTAELVQAAWQAIGADVTVKVYEVGDVNQNAIRERDYDVLLFGIVVARETDLYSFWHSSQRLDPGLNVALYTNITADKLLDGARTAAREDRQKKYQALETELAQDIPAIFLFRPHYLYLTDPAIHGIELAGLRQGSDRFNSISRWYRTTDKVWRGLANN